MVVSAADVQELPCLFGWAYTDEHRMRLWDWAEWSGLVGDSPFVEAAAFDGNRSDHPPLPVGPALEGRPLAWHELVLEA